MLYSFQSVTNIISCQLITPVLM